MAHPLVAIWLEAHADFRDSAVAAPWRHPTLLPGWTVADLVAHAAWIERTALGRQDPPHAPDWSRLPHATSDFGRTSEVPVDLRRSHSREEVLAELAAAVADRLVVLQHTDPKADAVDIFGRKRSLEHVLSDRIFDLWVHEQDIRVATASPGHLETQGARVTADVLIRGLGYVWGKRAGAPIGASLVVTTVGPGVQFSAGVLRNADGRAVPVVPAAEPTTRLTLTFANFVALACGRENADPRAVEIWGNQSLGDAVVANFAVTP
jgi:uncharacterized protein (TIGR03083 family)